MARKEFTKETKRDALRRSGGKCEAEGALYGLPAGERCNAPLSFGVQFDHILALSNGGDSSLENCNAVCVKCHGFKTATFDTPRAAKRKRQSDKASGIRKAATMPGSRNSRFKKLITGEVVDRRTGEIL